MLYVLFDSHDCDDKCEINHFIPLSGSFSPSLRLIGSSLIQGKALTLKYACKQKFQTVCAFQTQLFLDLITV